MAWFAVRETVLAAFATRDVPARPTAPLVGPPDCAGSYLCGDLRYSVWPGGDGGFVIRVGAMTLTDITFHLGLVFSAAGQGHSVLGRFLRDPHDHEISLMELGGRVARREPAVRE